MHGAFQAHVDADRTRSHLPGHVLAGAPCRVDARERIAPQVGRVVHLQQQDRQRAPRHLRDRAQDLEVALAEIRIHLDHAATGTAHRARDAGQLRFARGQAGSEAPVSGAVLDRARGAEAQRASAQGLLDHRLHARDVTGIRLRAVIRAALAHRVEAQRRVRNLRAHVHHARHRLEHVEVLREALPAKIDALGEHGLRDILHALHQLDQIAFAARPYRGEADAAVAEHRGGHAVPRRRRELGIPGRLTVVVRVDVHPAGREQQAGRVDLARAGADLASDRCDAARLDGDVRTATWGAGAVHQRGVAYHQIVHAASCRSVDQPCENIRLPVTSSLARRIVPLSDSVM